MPDQTLCNFKRIQYLRRVQGTGYLQPGRCSPQKRSGSAFKFKEPELSIIDLILNCHAMAEKEIYALPDKSVIPDDDLIFSLIGEKKVFWQEIMSRVSENHKDISGSWNYYNDGKQWLFKMVNRKKTIFWGAILNNAFRITFYFGDKAQPVIDNSDLPADIKEAFLKAKRYGLIRPVSFLVNNKTDVDNVLNLVEIKKKIK